MKTVSYSLPLVVVFASLCGFGVVDSKKDCGLNRLSTSKLLCYYSSLEAIDGCSCTHVILPVNSDVKRIEALRSKGVKVFVGVSEFHQELIDLLKSTKVDGLELNLKKLTSKNDISDFISTIKTKLGADLDIALSVPAKAELVAKYFDFKALAKHADFFILQTAFLGASTNVTFHPSRLSGMWDMQNTDSLVDLVAGLGVPLSKLVVTAPVQAYQFKLQNPEYTAPGSPALEIKSIKRDELCKIMKNNKNWTLERDEDQAGPYIFSEDEWIAFDDSKSIDIKAKYARVRGLAGIALKDLVHDGGSECGLTMLDATYNGLSRQARAPRGAVLHSLEREIVDSSAKHLDSVQLSPFRISRIIDTEGKIHVIRQDSRTEFQCSRQGYFVHPRSCNRFYRCVKFDQLKEEYNVFEFDCPAGLAFDERVEVCVWPGSLPHGTPCSGSSEIAPVPRERFVCPSEPGYYADPENCRWFFACLDHGKSPLQAYEFRCPFGLVFDGDRLVCEWPWLVPKCSHGAGSGLLYGGPQGDNQIGGYQPITGAAGVILQSYDGLGSLGAVQLGGVSGLIEKPITALFSNAASGTSGLGFQIGQGYIEGSGLNYKEAQALHNAGLLRVNNAVGYGASGHDVEGTQHYASLGLVGHGQAEANAVAFTGAVDVGSRDKYYTSGQYEASAGPAIVNEYQVDNNGAKGAAVSSQSFTQYHGQGAQRLDNAKIEYASNTGAGSYDYGGASLASSTPGWQSIGYKVNQGLASWNQRGSGINLLNSVQDVAPISSQSYTQYNGEKESKNTQQFGAGVVGGINIIGGGYSAVGTLSNVNLLPNGQNQLVPATPEILPVAKIPTVTAVPVPGIKTVSGFETIRGGVIANIPELQYKVKSFEDAGLLTNGSNFVNFVVTSGQANQQAYSQTGGYVYNQPTVAFEEKPISTVSSTSQVYISSTPSPIGVKPFVRVPGVAISTPKPFGVTYQKYHSNGGYNYEKPLVKFQEVPVSTPKPIVLAEQPQLIVSSSAAPHLYKGEVNINEGGYGSNHAAIASFENPVGQTYYQKPGVVGIGQNQIIQYYQPQQEEPVPLTQQPERLSTYTYLPPVQKQPTFTPYTYQSVAQQAVGAVFKQPPISVQQPIHSYSYQPSGGTSYHYINSDHTGREGSGHIAPIGIYQISTPKPAVVVDEVPVGHSTPAPIQPAVVNSYFNIQNSKSQVENQQENVGYTYSKPSIGFEEAPVSYSTSKPAIVSSYFNIQSSKAKSENQQENIGHTYSKPSIGIEEDSVIYSTPKSAIEHVQFVSGKKGSDYQGHLHAKLTPIDTYQISSPRPAVVVQEVPVVHSTHTPIQSAVVNSYFSIQNSKSQAANQQENVGYTYSKPSTGFEEGPVTYSTSKPAIVSSYFNIQSSKAKSENQQENIGYTYSKPSIAFEEAPVIYSTPKPAIAILSGTKTSDYQVHAKLTPIGTYQISTPRPAVVVEDVPVVHSTPTPIQPAAVNSYFNIQNSKSQSENHQENVGYTYSRPPIGFEEAPITYSTSKPAIVSSYFNIQTSKAKAENQQKNVGYTYAKPSIAFEEAAVIYSTPKPAVEHVQVPIQPAVVSTYFNLANTGNEQEQAHFEYTHSRPAESIAPALVTSYYNLQNYGEVQKAPLVISSPQPISTIRPFTASSYFHLGSSNSEIGGGSSTLNYEAIPEVSSTPRPVVTVEDKASSYFGSTTPQPILVQNQVSPSVRPAVVSSYFHQQPSKGYEYPKPAVSFNEEAVPEVPFVKKTAYVTGEKQQNYEGGYKYQNAGRVVVESYKIPQYEKVKQAVYDQQQPQVITNYVPSTPRPTFISTIKTIAKQAVTPSLVTSYDSRYTSTPPTYVSSTSSPVVPVISTTSRPISRYSFSSLDEEYQYNNLLKVKATTVEPLRTYLPVTPTVRISTGVPPKVSTVVEEYVAPEAREYLPPRVRAKTPSREYLPVDVTTPSREYLPSRRIKVTSTTAIPEITTLSREYLPVKSRVTVTTKGKPSRPVTIIKSNDAHPLLSAKLGAQCTCVSNSLRLRKKQKIIIVDDDDDDDDDDGYEVDNGNALADYEAQRVVDVTPTPEVYIRTSSIKPQVYVKKLVRVKPAIKQNYYSPVTDVKEVFYQEKSSPVPEPSDGEIVKAVRTGLKLVKQAAKEGAREGTAEVLSKQLDRYGPGGVRSRSETLQGTIDCQRAGLFRHPTECNKFYACRWDCTKNRFTLHVFNCPVQLTFDNNLGACNWPSQGPTCVDNTLITSD